MRGGRGRGIFAGGYTPSGNNNTMNYIEIATTGNAVDFGDLARSGSTGSSSSATRGVFNYGNVPSNVVEMNYTTISSSGGVADYGDLSYVTRDGPFGAGDNNIDFITFATIGDSTEFGTLTIKRRGVGACSSPTRTVWGGGYIKPQSHTQVVDYVITQTKGDATHFGELTVSRGQMGAVSSTTRGIWYGGSIYGPDAPAYNYSYIRKCN
jgi:hypothetical protein